MPASASEFAASMRLRGGYDNNPLLIPDGKGSAFTTLDGAIAAGRNNDGWVNGITAEFSVTKFTEEEFRAFQNHRVRLRLSNENVEDFSLDGTTTFAAISAYDTKVALAAQRAHIQYVAGKLRPFVAGEVRLVSLNELNPLLGDFLPEPMRFMRGTVTPGVAYVDGKAEIGVSIAAGRTKFESEFDLFGFKRDNNRLQPTAYVKIEKEEFSLRGSLSHFRAASEDEFFTDVSQSLFDLGGSATLAPDWSIEVSYAKTAEETTFPVSPMTINHLFQATLTHSFNEKTTIGLSARALRRDYWDTPLYARTRIFALDASYRLGSNYSLTGELSFARSLLLSGLEAEAVVTTVGVTRRFNFEEKKK